MVIKKISKSCHILKSFSAFDGKLLLKKLQTHANNYKAEHAQCKHYTFNTRSWLPVMIDSTTLLISCKINFLSCYEKTWKNSTWNNNLHKQDSFFIIIIYFMDLTLLCWSFKKNTSAQKCFVESKTQKCNYLFWADLSCICLNWDRISNNCLCRLLKRLAFY